MRFNSVYRFKDTQSNVIVLFYPVKFRYFVRDPCCFIISARDLTIDISAKYWLLDPSTDQNIFI